MKQLRLWADTETTGTNSKENALIQVAGLVEVDGAVVEEFNITTKPFEGAIIVPEAMETNGLTEEEIQSYPTNKEAFTQLISVFDNYINRFDPNDKFVLCGFRIDFDYDFIYSFAQRCDKFGTGSYIFNCTYDVRTVAAMAMHRLGLRLKKYRLVDFCELFSINLDNAHDALADIKATRTLNTRIATMLRECKEHPRAWLAKKDWNDGPETA